MGIFKYALSSVTMRVDLGIVLITLPFIMIGFLFMSVIYLTFRLWLSDIILKFLIEIFTGEMVDIKEYPKKDRNSMNRYISIGAILLFIEPTILMELSLYDNKILYYGSQIVIVAVTVGLVYRKLKK